ncbi:MAG: hypothetical protein Q7T54_03110 [Candidatus Levybacteria bacterium]|nr:hypothetical protein [Candidatus Levybacteria bacterium]
MDDKEQEIRRSQEAGEKGNTEGSDKESEKSWSTDTTERHQEEPREAFISNISSSFIDIQRKKIQEKYPLVPKDAGEEVLLKGRISVLTSAISSENGLMSIAENLSAATPDLSDQLRTNLFIGAAASLTDCVLGNPDMYGFDERDQNVWNDRFNREEKYLHDLFEERQKIDDKLYRYGPSETLQILNAIEYALYLEDNGESSENYIDSISKSRAKLNLGLADIPIENDQFDRRYQIEKDYICDAIEANEASRGRKNLTHQDSPSYDFDTQYEDVDPPPNS